MYIIEKIQPQKKKCTFNVQILGSTATNSGEDAVRQLDNFLKSKIQVRRIRLLLNY